MINSMTKLIDNEKNRKIIFAFVAVFSVLLFFWKLPFGWGAYDEPFYISLPYRFVVAPDTFVADEWNLAQFSSFVLIIPVKLFSMLVPDMEGVVLFFRILYGITHLLIACLIIKLLKREGAAAYLSSVSYLLFVPFNIMNFSYDAVGLDCILICTLLVYSQKGSGKTVKVVIGALFSIAVLCNPFLVLVFILLFFTTVIIAIKKRNIEYLNIRDLILVSVGILVVALPIIVFILGRSDMGTLIQNLPEMFNDPTHGNKSIMPKLYETAMEIKKIYFPWIILWPAITVIQAADKGRQKRKMLYVILSFLIFLVGIHVFVFNIRVNCYMLPFAAMGLNMYILSKKKDKRKLFLWMAGALYGAFMWVASDQKMFIISMAMCISDIAALLILGDLYRENKNDFIKIGIALVIIIQLCMQAVGISRATHWESERVEKLDTVFEKGPLKGLRTTKDKVDAYNLRLEDISQYAEGDGRIAFMTLSTWEYLYVGRPYGTFSSWLGYTDDFVADKFISWCRLHPEKRPNEIYFPQKGPENWDMKNIEKIADNLDYVIIKENTGIKLIPKSVD